MSTNVFADTLKSQLLKTFTSQHNNSNQTEKNKKAESIEGIVPQNPVITQPQQPVVPEPQVTKIKAPSVPSIQPLTNTTNNSSNNTSNISNNPNAVQPE